MIVLGIESTCDETACAIVKDGREILANVVASQAEMHEVYGGVVPELACRRHVDLVVPVIEQAITKAKINLEDVDLIAVAHAPGLVGALLIGLNAAKSLAITLKKPFIGVNHIEAHLYAAMMSHDEAAISYPCIGAVLSGGHTSLVLIRDIGDYELLSQTVDDAIGEAFDKVAKMMGLPYPGGPQIERLAAEGDPSRHPFRPGHVKRNPLNFSFSGLKTAVLYAIRGQNIQNSEITPTLEEMRDIAASFQRTALLDILEKTGKTAEMYGCRQVIFGGGVTNNQALRRLFSENSSHLECLWPTMGLSLDNAAMIAGLGYHKYRLKGCGDPLDLEPQTRLSCW
ncbi:MAG: tRNA (adenosine(37)-N6)-threonylcarbamoyltransferase complex transferase subunit TsaD [Chlamydiia bacterium]|nr:tRNA (adenosine(37)-N6)-threonylcarbamoyltransferase complex transferase subunit TsaD [Chlamydiia bacterium]